MAILKMEKIQIVGLLDDQTEILNLLQHEGAVELIDLTSEDADPSHDDDRDLGRVQIQEQRLLQYQTRLRRAIEICKLRYPEQKLSYDQLDLNENAFLQIAHETETVFDRLTHFESLLDEETQLKAQLEYLSHKMAILVPWLDLDLDLAARDTLTTALFLGRIHTEAQTELNEKFAEHAPYTALVCLKEDEESCLAAVVALKGTELTVMTLLKAAEFEELPLEGAAGTPRRVFNTWQAEMTRIKERLEEIEQTVSLYAEQRLEFMLLSDYYLVLRKRLIAQTQVDRTRYTFNLHGYIPVKRSRKVKQALEERFTVAVQIAPLTSDEDHPIALSNAPFNRDYQVVLEMFGAPKAKEVDPTPILAPFTFIFFGMMLSDVGYGLLLTLVCSYMIWGRKAKGESGKLFRMLFFSGISSTFWGFIFGGFFGNLIQTVTQNPKFSFALWFDPMSDPQKLMLWSMMFGVIHLFFGMGLKMLNEFRFGSWQNAVFDVIPWYLIIGGGGLLAVQAISGSAVYGAIGKWLALAGVAIIVLFGGRSDKNPILRILKGVLKLYDVTGYFGDILSYTRILALVLATSVIASVVNLLGFMVGPSPVGYLVFTVVAIFGHTVNLALSGLSAYVHSSRLQYVEFFGKFFEGGGRFFEPLRYETEYISLSDKNER